MNATNKDMGQDRHFAGEHYVMDEDLFPTIVRNMNTKFNKLQHYEWEAQQNPVKSIIVDVINSPAKQTPSHFPGRLWVPTAALVIALGP